jgi:diaminopimelate epimerase
LVSEETPHIPFEKWQGLGNHFIVLQKMPANRSVAELCDPRLGVGADGVLLIELSPPRMTVFNADGSRAAMCGNGLRCAARYLAQRGADLSSGIATDSGQLAIGTVGGLVTVAVGLPKNLGMGSFQGYDYVHIDIGNPHAVFLDPAGSFDLEGIGEAMQSHPDFSDGVNVHEVRTGASVIIVVPFERGVGLTQACGTGAAASAFAVQATQASAWPLTIELPGGLLTFEPSDDGLLWMSGPAERVFTGLL